MTCSYEWRGAFGNSEVSSLHSDAFQSEVIAQKETDWNSLLERQSLGWVTARDDDQLLGFVNVIWDGGAHAWIQDVMVSSTSRRMGIGTKLVSVACQHAKDAGCEWLHVDFEERLGLFYFVACGFEPTTAGLIRLRT